MMVLYWYLQPWGALSNPSGPASAYVSPTAIKDANEAVRNASQGSSKPKGKYTKFTPEQKASISEYGSLHGNQAAARLFLKQLGVEMKPISVQTLKGKYLAKISRKRKAGETCDLSIKSFPVKKRGSPLLPGEELDTEVKRYNQVVREGGVLAELGGMAFPHAHILRV